jgi:hypothetical protein
MVRFIVIFLVGKAPFWQASKPILSISPERSEMRRVIKTVNILPMINKQTNHQQDELR